MENKIISKVTYQSNLTKLLQDLYVIKIFNALDKKGINARLVGGCVRDAIMGNEIFDIDFATPATSEKITEALESQNIKVYPTGISHGTVTAVINNTAPFEITTLRRDVLTDGRHAQVEFTNDWQEDAARRDFTFNALYLDRGGTLYDYFGGIQDLQNGIVKFIGDPEQRIQEDYLRILRYYRFFLRYGKEHDISSKNATIKFQDGLKNLSKERICSEFFKILEHDNPLQILKIMEKNEFFQIIFGKKIENFNFFILERVLEFQRSAKEKIILNRLFALFPEKAAFFKRTLKLSNKQLLILKALYETSSYNISDENLFEINYRYGFDIAEMFLQLKLITTTPNIYNTICSNIKNLPSIFPIQGKDLIDMGIESGARMGKLLSACENFWVDSLGKATKAECLAFLQGML
ncbi:MAG: CCA tRNA nucleotidyltransferase [Holosporales bacterium]|nr:CCA tRNA nucleotidyltransferase [Holosporales bacterium]